VFCPNCGTKNDGVALPCKKCGFKLSGASAPKFRGTMMLQADQSVQELIDEHRRKQAEEGEAPPADEPGVEPEGSNTAPADSGVPFLGMSSTPSTPLQPPRAGLPKRRMGTMMGVAPQVGGVQPPEADSLFAGTTPSPPEAMAPAEGALPSARDPFAGTEAVPVLPFPTPPADGLLAGRTEAFEAVPAAPQPAAAQLRAEEASDAAWMESASAAPAAPRRTEPWESVAPPRRTEPMQSVAPPPRRRRVRPLDVFLILITFGLYGFVLLARQRGKRPDPS